MKCLRSKKRLKSPVTTTHTHTHTCNPTCVCVLGDPGREHVFWLHDDTTNAGENEHCRNSKNSENSAKGEDAAVVLEKLGFREYVPLLSLSREVPFCSFFSNKNRGEYAALVRCLFWYLLSFLVIFSKKKWETWCFENVCALEGGIFFIY